ncbi:MAG: toxin-antitoxin system HicB family antitoxin [Clostridia bacterium]|nr:toxin-antitoxin system HicB family antitoxin [Clostridia bacterium]
MKSIEEYMRAPYRMEVIPDPSEGGYVVSFPELKGCLTCADTLEQAMANAEDAKRQWLTAAMEDGCVIPLPEAEEEFSGQFKLRLPKSLHRQLAMQSRREGISMNQYCVYLLSQQSAGR